MNEHNEIPNYQDELLQLNELLERLNQAGYKALGGINVNIYKPGSQHVDRVETQYIGAYPPTQPHPTASPPAQPHPLTPSPKGEGECLRQKRGVDSSEKTKGLPEVLATEEAMRLWEKGRQAGYVDECYQPLISRTQSALLADAMAERLGIKEKWKAFEELWHRKYMRNDYNLALTQRQSYMFQDKLKRLFSMGIAEKNDKT